LPSRALAEGVAAEWDGVADEIKPLTMHLTRCANATIDKVAHEREAVGEMLAEYGGTDLVCYRAVGPQALIERQASAWDPLLEWAVTDLEAPLEIAYGVMHIAQPPQSLEKLRAAVLAYGPWQMTALHDLVTIPGSLLLGLAVARGHLTAEDAWPLARIDETWQEELWGFDEEAAAAAANKKADFLKAERLLHLLAAD